MAEMALSIGTTPSIGSPAGKDDAGNMAVLRSTHVRKDRKGGDRRDLR
ncbi:MAG: hypothetical protein WCF30_08020 [Terracidiphilus sp.]